MTDRAPGKAPPQFFRVEFNEPQAALLAGGILTGTQNQRLVAEALSETPHVVIFSTMPVDAYHPAWFANQRGLDLMKAVGLLPGPAIRPPVAANALPLGLSLLLGHSEEAPG